MPILNQRKAMPKKPSTLESPQKPVVQKDNYASSVVDTQYQPKESLLTHIEGSPWQVTYYQQILGGDEELASQELDKHPVYQQYIEIKGLELRVSDGLTGSQSTETKSLEYSGQAYLYPPVIPNVGDMFLADIGDGREGVFTVTASERLSLFKQSCFSIEYTLRNLSTEERRQDLKNKSVEEQHFVKSFLQHGKSPLVVDTDYKAYMSLDACWGQLLSYYMVRYYDHEIASLKVPDQRYVTYDPFLVSFLKAFVEGTEHPNVYKMKRYATDIAGYRTPHTLWDALLHPAKHDLDVLQHQLALVDSKYFGIVPQYESVYFSAVKDVVYPIDGPYDQLCHTDFGQGGLNARDIAFQFKETKLGRLSDLSQRSRDRNSDQTRIHPVTKDTYYVFSRSFYHRDSAACGLLERLVLDYLSGEALNYDDLRALSDDAKRWTTLDGFYYIPVLLLLIKQAMRG